MTRYLYIQIHVCSYENDQHIHKIGVVPRRRPFSSAFSSMSLSYNMSLSFMPDTLLCSI